jgi:methylmalonyl-CoA mutase N-terminal domain/subunit
MLQNDPLKEYAARGTFIFPADTAVRLAVDTIEFLMSNFPNWEPIEFCGYHFRDAGATAVQEIAFSTANGLAYLDTAQERGVDIGTLAPHLFLFLNANIDVFEEAAKFRAARRLWAKLLHGRYGVPRDVARMNIFAYTSGAMLWAQEPMNNVVRVTLETLGAALGGVQTLATTSYDEALGLPTESAAHLALRTQQIVAYESGAAKVADPLGGSRYVEDLTIRLESQIAELLIEIVELGGALAALDSGFIQNHISEAAYTAQLEVENGSRPVVGVNIHGVKADELTKPFVVPDGEQAAIIERLRLLRNERNSRAVHNALEALDTAARAGDNIVPTMIAAARAGVTLGEIIQTLRAVHGSYDSARVYI